MSAIARILLARGERVLGSDIALSPLVEELRREGARITIGHHARNVHDVDAVIVSSAIDRRNPEYAAAMQLGIPVLRRGEMLSRLLRDRRGIAVCGTHGKTTTTAMTHAVLRRGGIDASLVLGGIDVELGNNAYDGTSPWFVTEADESDGSFALLEPAMAIVTNIENDHLTSDDELPGLARAFAEFLAKLPEDGLAVIGVDNPLSASLESHELRARIVTFGLASNAWVRAANLSFADFGSKFDVVAGGRTAGNIELRVPGRINVENALAAIAIGAELGVPFAAIADALRAFRGRAPPVRRLDLERARHNRRRLRASSDRGARDDRSRAPLSPRGARGSLSAASLHANGFLSARVCRLAARRRSRLSGSRLRRLGAGDSRRERTFDWRAARGERCERHLCWFVARTGEPPSGGNAGRRDGAGARRRRYHRDASRLAARIATKAEERAASVRA